MQKINSLAVDQFDVKADLSVFGCHLHEFPLELQLARDAISELQISHPESTPSNVNAVYMSPWKSHTMNGKFLPLIQIMAAFIKRTSLEHLKTDIRSGSVCLNSLLGPDKWMTAFVMLPAGLPTAY